MQYQTKRFFGGYDCQGERVCVCQFAINKNICIYKTKLWCKAKKAPAAKPVEAAAPAAAEAAAAAPATPAATSVVPPTPSAPAPSTAAAATPAAAAPASDVSSPDEFPAEVVNNLMALGFPESSVRACLRASDGNPDIAVEFLMNGIPPEMEGGDAPSAGASSSEAGGSSGSAGPLEALRRHPQFDALRRLVQSNPSMLQAVLSQIDPFAGVPGMEALGNPVQLAQMLQAMPPQEQQAMAQMMGMDVNQLQQLAQMISAMPPEQVQQHMNMAMQAQGLGGLMGGAGRGGMGGAQVLRLSEEEMAAVDRLTEMGFDRTEAAQAYLACDKNEALAANLLMDGGFGGFGGMDGEDDMGGDDDGGDDDMYD